MRIPRRWLVRGKRNRLRQPQLPALATAPPRSSTQFRFLATSPRRSGAPFPLQETPSMLSATSFRQVATSLPPTRCSLQHLGTRPPTSRNAFRNCGTVATSLLASIATSGNAKSGEGNALRRFIRRTWPLGVSLLATRGPGTWPNAPCRARAREAAPRSRKKDWSEIQLLAGKKGISSGRRKLRYSSSSPGSNRQRPATCQKEPAMFPPYL
jgi:hypothetical protein